MNDHFQYVLALLFLLAVLHPQAALLVTDRKRNPLPLYVQLEQTRLGRNLKERRDFLPLKAASDNMPSRFQFQPRIPLFGDNDRFPTVDRDVFRPVCFVSR